MGKWQKTAFVSLQMNCIHVHTICHLYLTLGQRKRFDAKNDVLTRIADEKARY